MQAQQAHGASVTPGTTTSQASAVAAPSPLAALQSILPASFGLQSLPTFSNLSQPLIASLPPKQPQPQQPPPQQQPSVQAQSQPQAQPQSQAQPEQQPLQQPAQAQAQPQQPVQAQGPGPLHQMT